MWIVRLALRRPYTFVVLSLLLFIVGPVVDAADTRRYLSEHRYSGRLRHLELRGHVARRS